MTVEAPPETVTSEPSSGKWLAVSLVAGLVWVVVLMSMWALRPLSDSMIVGYNELESGAFQVVTETTECNNLFASEARDAAEPLPDLGFGFAFSRPPCEKPHADARVLFVLNAIVLGVAATAWVVGYRHWRRTQP